MTRRRQQRLPNSTPFGIDRRKLPAFIKKLHQRYAKNYRLLAGFLLVAISIIPLAIIFGAYKPRPATLGGVQLMHTCRERNDLVGDLSISRIKDSLDLSVTIGLIDKENRVVICPVLLIFFPSNTTSYSYLVESNLGEPSRPNESFGDELFFQTFPVLEQDVVIISSDATIGFSGYVNFIWQDGLSQLGIDRLRLIVPFGIVEMEPYASQITMASTQVTNYFVSVSGVDGYELSSSSPNPVSSHRMENLIWNNFEVNITETDLDVRFQNEDKAWSSDFEIFLASLFLGIGLTMVIEETVSRFSRWGRREED